VTHRVALDQLREGLQPLPAEASRHLCRVLRLGAGDAIVVFDPREHTEADAVIADASGPVAHIVVGSLRPASVTATRTLALVYALAKGDKVDLVVQDATELGATHIFIARSERCVVKLDAVRAQTKHVRWRRIAEQAARQCGRGDPPAIEAVLDWPEALARAAAVTRFRFCLWEKAISPLGPSLLRAIEHDKASVAFAVGPEGGLSPADIAEAEREGYATASLGPLILRTETVAAAVLGALRIFGSTP